LVVGEGDIAVRLITLSAMLALIAIAAAVIAVTRAPASRLAIFDAHIHYSEPSWKSYPPLKICGLLRDAGIAGAAISSSPDDGTRRLVSLNRTRFVAVLRPYREGGTSTNWAVDPTGERYLDERLASGRYEGIGEVHF